MRHLREEFTASFSAMLEPQLWHRRFVFFCLLNLFVGSAVIQPWTFIYSFARSVGVPAGPASSILSSMGISLALGQIGFGFLADFLNAYLLFDVCVLACGIFCFCISYATSLAPFLALGVLFAAAMGGVMALYSLIVVDLVGESRLIPAFGVYLPFVGCGNLIGSLVSGWASERASYRLMFQGGGALLVLLSAATLPFLCRPLRAFGVLSVRKKSGP